jgi:penicillin amidase
MRLLLRVLGVILLLVLIAAGLAVWTLRRSLPPARESVAVRGIQGPVTITLDSLGVPTIRATNPVDLAFGQGYAHARDRRFQMELIRRSAAGRLSEVFGALALEADREARAVGFGAMADSVLGRISPGRRARFAAYAAGVNAWDAAHPAPPEFLALRIPMEPWRTEDFALVVASMFRDLQYGGGNERMFATLDAALPRPLVDFLTPDATPIDVVLAGGAPPPVPQTPGPGVVDLRTRAAAGESASLAAPRRESDPMRGEHARGSNHWVVAAARTRHGRAIMSSDPHLGLRVPVIWHRQRLEAPGIAVTGITLPGAPDVVMGSNGRVAWSMTNLEGDFTDYVRVRAAGAETLSYAGPAGPEPFRIRREVIRVRNAPAETLRVRETRWGPVVGPAPGGGHYALQWVALDPSSYDFDMLEEARAGDVDQLVRAFDGFFGPAFNVVAADAGGRIGWRIIGRIPRRAGFDPRRPREGAAPNADWSGYLPQDSMPRVIDPAAGFLVTANQRTVGGEDWKRIGTGAAAPWRARRIHDVLATRTDWDAEASAVLQNDVDDALLGTTATALGRALTPDAIGSDSTRAAVRGLLDRWDHRADSTSASHAFLRYVRVALHELLFEPLVAPCRAIDPAFVYAWQVEDEVARRLLDERPAHLLDPRFADFDELVLAAADSAAARLRRRVPGVPLGRIHWGYLNRARIRHPLGAAVPALAKWLNMPDAALAGGSAIVRVARPASGASMRMIVELGGESRFALPGGQSGHFLSRHYGDGFADWVAGRYGPLEPGSARGEIRLTPR